MNIGCINKKGRGMDTFIHVQLELLCLLLVDLLFTNMLFLLTVIRNSQKQIKFLMLGNASNKKTFQSKANHPRAKRSLDALGSVPIPWDGTKRRGEGCPYIMMGPEPHPYPIV